MNNCQKCGNPLQPGTTSCPICGTIINNEPVNLVGNTGVVTPSSSINQNIAQPVNPVQEQIQSANPVQQSTTQPMNAPITETTNQQPNVVQPVSVAPTTEQTTSSVVTSVPPAIGTETAVNAQNVQTPIVETPVQPVSQTQTFTQSIPVVNSQQTSVASQPTVQPVLEATMQVAQPATQPTLENPTQPAQTVVQQPVQSPQQNSVIEPLNENTGIPSSLTPGVVQPINIPEKKTTKKFSLNNKTLIIAGVIFVVVLIAIFVLTSNNFNKNNNNNSNNTNQNETNNDTEKPSEETALAITNTTINNYFLKIPDGWNASAYSSDVEITNGNETAYALISSVSGDLSQTNETTIKNNLIENELTDVKVEEITLDSKKAYKATFIEEDTYPVEIYYIDNNGTRIICVYTIYETSEDKDQYNEDLVNIVKTIDYQNKTQNAIDPNGIYFNKLQEMKGIPFLQPIEPEEEIPSDTPDIES